MKPEFKRVTILLAILAILDAAAVPFMIAANHHTHGTPPVPAIAVAAVLAGATLISAFGVAQGLRWAFRVAMTCRIVDTVTNLLGLTNHPTPATTIGGGVGFALSLVAIVLLVQVNPRRKARLTRRATAPTTATAATAPAAPTAPAAATATDPHPAPSTATG